MPAAYSPVEQFDTTTQGLPDGSPVNDGIFRTMQDRDEYVFQLARPQLVWRGGLYAIEPLLAAGNTGVWVPPIERVSLRDGGMWRQHDSGGAATQINTVLHNGGVALVANTWYYVYAISGGMGVLDFVLGTAANAPDAALVWSTLNPNVERYLGTFRTDNNALPLPFRAMHGVYRYRAAAASIIAGVNPTTGVAPYNQVLVDGVAIAWTTVSPWELVPPHAYVANVRASIRRNAALGGGVSTGVRATGDVVAAIALLAVGSAGVDSWADFQHDVVTSALQQIDYIVANPPAGAGYGLQLWIDGFME